MPSGFTYRIADGTETTIRQFALRCARGMGALVTMRDDPIDAPIPTELDPDTAYHDERIADAEATLARLRGMTTEATYAAAEKEYRERHQAWFQRRQDDEAKYDRYSRLITEASQLIGLPEGLQGFMVQQLAESRSVDCTYPNDPKYDPEPVLRGGEEWLAEQLAGAERILAYHTEQRQKELDRTAERNAWLAQLHTALKGLPE